MPESKIINLLSAVSSKFIIFPKQPILYTSVLNALKFTIAELLLRRPVDVPSNCPVLSKVLTSIASFKPP